jgi:hypothetical protein
MRITSTGAVQVGLALLRQHTLLDVNADTVRVQNRPHTSIASATGATGETAGTFQRIYVCTATNTGSGQPLYW